MTDEISNSCIYWYLFVCSTWNAGAKSGCYPLSGIVTEHAGEFRLQKGTIGYADPMFLSEANFLKEKLQALSFQMKVKKGSLKTSIALMCDAGCQQKDAYRVQITPKQVIISGSTATGIFYGIQTFLQLVNNEGGTLKCCEIQDSPRYAWRGYMLDEARHFFGKEKVKQLLDQMAYYKLNKFHWHLTDEPGWRIEIKKYPRLTSVGGERKLE